MRCVTHNIVFIGSFVIDVIFQVQVFYYIKLYSSWHVIEKSHSHEWNIFRRTWKFMNCIHMINSIHYIVRQLHMNCSVSLPPPPPLHFVFWWVYNARPTKSLQNLPYLSDKHQLAERNECKMVYEMSIYTVVLSHNNQEKELEWSDPEVVKVSIKNTRHSYINRNKKNNVGFNCTFCLCKCKTKKDPFCVHMVYLKLLLFSLLVLYVDFPFSF